MKTLPARSLLNHGAPIGWPNRTYLCATMAAIASAPGSG